MENNKIKKPPTTGNGRVFKLLVFYSQDKELLGSADWRDIVVKVCTCALNFKISMNELMTKFP